MIFSRKNKIQPIKLAEKNVLDDYQMKNTYGSGNSQVRYIPDEFVQAKILKESTPKS